MNQITFGANKLIKFVQEKFINSFEHEDGEIQVLNGRWGPYIKQGRKNYKIPKEVEAKDLAFDEVIHIMKNQPKKGAKRKVSKKNTTKKK